MSEDRSEREQWAEMEALQFEKSAQYIQDCIAGWLKAGDRTSPEGFMKCAEIGRKIARQNAVQKLWPLMGYALKERLAGQA